MNKIKTAMGPGAPLGDHRHQSAQEASEEFFQPFAQAAARGFVVKIESIEVGKDEATIRLGLSHWLPTPAESGIKCDPSFDPWSATLDEALRYGTGSAEVAAFVSAHIVMTNQGKGRLGVHRALAMVLAYELKPPSWLVDAFLSAMRRLDRFEVAGLDAAFQNQPLTERERKHRRRHKELVERVGKALCDAIDSDPDRPIDIGLFEEVGADLGIGKTLCRELYDEGVSLGYQDLKTWRQLRQEMRRRKNSGESSKSAVLPKRP